MRIRTGNAQRLLLAAILAGATVALADSPVDQIARKVDARYNDMRSLSADFTEIYSGTGVARSESGVLWLKRPGKMRWEYREPREKLFITDGKTAYFYVPGERQARRAPVKNLDDLRSPLRYLLGKTKLQKEFTGLSLAPDVQPESAGDVVLRGVPKAMTDRVESVLLEVTPEGEIRRIVIDEIGGATTEFRFSNQRQNLPVADDRFRFKPPAGVELVEVPDVTGS